MLNLVLLGPPGAGKGTQAGYLVRAYGLLHISTGDILREEAKADTELGGKLRGYMERGELVPDETVIQLMARSMDGPEASVGVIFDGYPRTRKQAEALEEVLDEKGAPVTKVLYLRTSEEVAVDRLAGRRTCPECKHNYHLRNMPPKEDEKCDDCGVSLIQREDDRPETVRNRLAVYEQQTSELVEHYRAKGLLEEVDGDLDAEKLFQSIDALFKSEGLVQG